MLHWRALKHTKDVMIQHLRMFYNNYENYQYLLPPQIDDDHYTNMDIFDVEPQQLRKFPLIILNGSGGRLVTTGLSDMAAEIYDPRDEELIGYKYGGIYEFSLNMEIGTRSTTDREFLCDMTSHALRFALRRQMEAKGVLVTGLSYGPQTTVKYDSDNIYVANIQITTWSEWYHNDIFVPMDGVKVKNVTVSFTD